MKIRIKTLWIVPVVCVAASFINYFLKTQIAAFLFQSGIAQKPGDPILLALDIILFLLMLFAGGVLLVRSMTRAEAAVSAAIVSAAYLILVLLQIYAPDFPVALSVHLGKLQYWSSEFNFVLMKLIGNLEISAMIASLCPFLFVLFGRKS